MSEIVTDIDTVRRFNRTYTPKIGALDDSFLGSGLPLAVARLLFEIGPTGATVLGLRRRLALDSGYLSRLLRRLDAAGLITVEPDPGDKRRRVCRLTPAGTRRWRQLDRRSDEIAERLLAPLTPGQRRRLTDALATAERLLRAAGAELVEVDPTAAAATAAMAAYFAELDMRFPNGFDAAGALGPGAAAMAAPHGTFLLAQAEDATTLACGGLQRVDGGTAEIKRMWVHPDWRGTGLGRRMLTALEQHAIRLGYDRVVLDTNGTLAEAISMYESTGYGAIPRYNDNPYAERWYAKQLDVNATA